MTDALPNLAFDAAALKRHFPPPGQSKTADRIPRPRPRNERCPRAVRISHTSC